MTRAPRPSNLAEVLDLILDKGIVIDAYVRVSVIGIEVLTIDLRVVVASVDTYLRFAEAVNRLDLAQTGDNMTLEDLTNKGVQGMGERKGEQTIEKAKDKLSLGAGDDQQQDDSPSRQQGSARKRSNQQRQDNGKDEENDGSRGVVGKIAQRARWS